MRDRKTFGLSWFSLTKEDDVRKKEAACDNEAPRREKDTFLTGLFSKRKGMESYGLAPKSDIEPGISVSDMGVDGNEWATEG